MIIKLKRQSLEIVYIILKNKINMIILKNKLNMMK